MGHSSRRSPVSNTRILHVSVDAELHTGLLVYKAKHGITHAEAVEAALRLLLGSEPSSNVAHDGDAS